MKRLVCLSIVLVYCVISLTGCIRTGGQPEELTDNSLEKFMEDISPYVQGLDISAIPVSVHCVSSYFVDYIDGETHRLYVYQDGEYKQASRYSEDNVQFTSSLFEEAETVLAQTKLCLKNGWYFDLRNDPENSVSQYQFVMNISEESIKLFPDGDKLSSILVQIVCTKTWEGDEGAILVQDRYLRPAGLIVNLRYNSAEDNVRSFEYDDEFGWRPTGFITKERAPGYHCEL